MRITLLSAVLLMMHWSFAQQLPNMDFENWSYNPLAKSNSVLDGLWDTPNNCLVTYPPNDPTPGPDTNCTIFATRQTDVKSGKYSIKLQNPLKITDSYVSLSTWDGTTSLVAFEFLPITFKGFYKFFKGNTTDIASITVNLYDDNVTTILYGQKELIKASTGWTAFTINLDKIPPNAAPKTVEILISHAISDDGVSPISPNTYLMLDNLSFGYSTSNVLDDAIREGLHLYDGVLDMSQMSGVEKISIYNAQGGLCGSAINQFDTKALVNGIYLVSFDQKGIVRSFKLPVKN